LFSRYPLNCINNINIGVMAIVRKSITFTDQQDYWIKKQIENGDYTNDSEYIRDLVRRDQQQKMKILDLKSAIDEGLQSGRSSLKISDIIKKVDSGEL
jgi:antitoxin ParD1/3/4